MALHAMGAQPVERRLAAVLAADVAGYSRLMGADEEGTHARLKAHRRELVDPKLAEHHGHVIRLTGDGILVEFPSVVEAVRCAVEVQQGMAERNADESKTQRIEFRVGINLGDVIIEDDGDIYGDGVNIAARLEALAEPGSVLISGAAYDQIANKLNYGYRFLGEQRLKNIAKPVRLYRVRPDVATAPAGALARRRRRPILIAAVASLIAICGAAVTARHLAPLVLEPDRQAGMPSPTSASAQNTALPLPDKPSIAVLPLASVSGDPTDETFADGLTEDIITELSRLQDLFVIARDSTFVLKGKAVNVQQIGRQFGVRYVLQGSVQRSDKQVRVTAQLIDAATGHHVWADRYDRTVESIFEVQEDLTTNIVGVLLSEVRAAETAAAFRKPTSDLRAYDLVNQSIRYRNTFTREANLRGREVLTKAIKLDPTYAEAYAWLGKIYGVDFVYRLTGPPRQETLDHALKLIEQAISLKPDLAVAYAFLNFAFFYEGRIEEALVAGRKSVELAPNDAECLIQLARVQMFNGLHADALATAEKAIRLNPSPPVHYFWIYGLTLYASGHYEKALDAFRTHLAMNPDIMFVHRDVASTLVRLGRIGEARAAAALFRQAYPRYSLQDARRRYPFKDTAVMNQYLGDLRMAGLPEE